MTVERGSGRGSVCPRCGAQLHRQRRRLAQRLLSIVYPVHAFVCSKACGWTGMLRSQRGWERRRRQLLVMVVLLGFGLGIGVAVWHFRGGLVWSPARPPGEGIGEIGEP